MNATDSLSQLYPFENVRAILNGAGAGAGAPDRCLIDCTGHAALRRPSTQQLLYDTAVAQGIDATARGFYSDSEGFTLK